jgi:hypothetical protein
MEEREQDELVADDIVIPYREGEFQEVAERLKKVAESFGRRPALGFVMQEMRFAAAALSRAEGLLSSSGQSETSDALTDQAEARAVAASQSEAEAVPAGENKPEVGARAEWTGYIGQQPTFDRLKDGRIRGVFFLAQHPDPNDREKTDWLRCYSLGRHAESLQQKGRLAGAEVVVRGTFQGLRPHALRDGTTVDQPMIYCYGVRIVRGPKSRPGQRG